MCLSLFGLGSFLGNCKERVKANDESSTCVPVTLSCGKKATACGATAEEILLVVLELERLGCGY